MSLIEFFVILLISLGIFDKTKLLFYFNKFQKYKNGQDRQIIGDVSIDEKWVWLEESEEE
ncbi:hypothetical protein N9U02_00215 [bacterium]|jgi:hypothetical protein|nr:hypothetical protein [Candidatus Actinomarina sp.]MDA9681458.1 hypothetical protein [bacterium]|tara:strand:+ start:20335 stop:20514 length:180 start_codon:yes stop_codon:yes gene_type:complete